MQKVNVKHQKQWQIQKEQTTDKQNHNKRPNVKTYTDWQPHIR